MEIKAAKRGGARTGAGRKKGVRDKATGEQRASLEELARTHTGLALDVLVHVAQTGESEAAKVSAANSILDRGYGRPRQGVDIAGDPDNPLRHKLEIDAEFAELVGALGIAAKAKSGGDSGSGGMDQGGAASAANP